MTLVDATELYGLALRSGEPLHWVTKDGRTAPLDIGRWNAPVDAVDRSVLDRCRGPVLDVGCGPGRILAELTARGVAAVGVDVSMHAVDLARERGGTALCRDVFSPLPAEGTWSSAVLLDGNIGIGGDPVRLLTRLGQIVAPGGDVVVETDPDPDADERHVVRLSAGAGSTGRFRWAFVGEHALRTYANAVGLVAGPTSTTAGRSFVTLTRQAMSAETAETAVAA